MPRRCIAAGCSTSSGEGHSLHAFPRDDSMRKKWIRAIKQQRSNWDGPSSSSLLCSKHFEPECFALEGARYRDAVGIPAKKRLKPDAVPTIFKRSIHSGSSGGSVPSCRPASEKRQRKSVSSMENVLTTCKYIASVAS